MKENRKLSRTLEKAQAFIQAGDRTSAVELLMKLCARDKKNADIRREAGIFFQQNNMPFKAEMFYRDSLRLDSKQAVVYFNLGVIYQNINQVEQAIECYRHAIATSSDYMRAYANLGYLYKQTGELEKCRDACLKAQALAPDDPQVNHMIASLGIEKAPEVADRDYIKSLYDNYADTYDSHLSVTLKSRVPELIYKTTLRFCGEIEGRKILDLGCGTGICGEFFAAHTGIALEGIDLSEKMIEQASAKNVYTALHVGDINEFLKSNTANYDIIISSDVLIYFGSLEKVFSGAARLLPDNGLLVFSVESLHNSSEDYILDDTGRYKHNHNYIKRLAESANLEMISSAETALRQQNKEDVIGRIYAIKQACAQ